MALIGRLLPSISAPFLRPHCPCKPSTSGLCSPAPDPKLASQTLAAVADSSGTPVPRRRLMASCRTRSTAQAPLSRTASLYSASSRCA